ncbi:hypothetical protein [Stenotrophomonas tuberculopleuritidis]|uniref:hypothetical protein n=1 Tax=Stenotrophomonas tuberculopleuritidis TaxID=3055079 RepID=UPI0026E56A9D|nr:hypothetical protein [Stenotrophomonas sp. 704A1]
MEDSQQREKAKTRSPADALVPLALALCMGVFTGAMVFGTEEAARVVFNKDVLIAFAAAAGTWAVGIGAWHYAKQAHLLREQEVRRAESDELLRSAAAFNRLRGAAVASMIPYQVLTAEDARLDEATALEAYRLCIAAARAAPSPQHFLDGPAASMDQYLIHALPHTALISIFVTMAETVFPEDERTRLPMPPWLHREVNAIIEAAKVLADSGEELAALLDENRKLLQRME